jgi:hypothetical protein
MIYQHRATEHSKNNVAMMPSEGTTQGMLADCIQEIFSRIEALEAAQLEAPMTELRAASAEARPAGGLVERVEEAIITGMVDGDRHAARAAIREVAAWLRENDSACQMGGDAAATADLLEQELREEADRG